MDEMRDFERLVAEETLAEAGPSRPTDVAAVIRSVAAKSPRWRFASMFSATKMLAATAVVALFGGFLLAASLAPDSAVVTPAAESPGSRADPVQFEGRWAYGDALPGGDYEFDDDGWSTGSDLGWDLGVLDPGDPRLDGDLTLHASSLRKGAIEIRHGAFRIENGDGAWQQQPMVQSVKLEDESEPMSWTAVFDGEGDYAGLTAVIGITRAGGGWDVESLIVDGPLPPAPGSLTRE